MEKALKLVVVENQKSKLPTWKPPKNLQQAKTDISAWGKNMHEHAYLVGKHLIWVKKEVGHGKFNDWVKSNLWFGKVTAQHMMNFALACIKSDTLGEYHGHRTKKLPGNHLKKKDAHPQARQNMLNKVDEIEGRSFTQEEWQQETTWQQRITLSLIPWVIIKEDSKTVDVQVDEELKDICEERYGSLERKGINTGDEIGHLIADKIRHLLADLNQSQRNIASFWIEAALSEFKEVK